MNLRYQTLPEAAEEVIAAIENEEEWLTVQDIADLLDIEADDDPEALKPLLMVLTFMARHGMVQRLGASIDESLYRCLGWIG
jgi:hypothetical protein